jgi:hypothetical protein
MDAECKAQSHFMREFVPEDRIIQDVILPEFLGFKLPQSFA